MTFEESIDEVTRALAELEQAQESAFAQSRRIIRKTKTAIHLIHEGRRDAELIDSISGDLAALVESVSEYPQVLYGQSVEDAMAEFAETAIYDYVSRGEEIPPYTILDVTPAAWVMGLADTVGELRRDLLRDLMEDDIDGAEEAFSRMEAISDALMSFDVRDSVAAVRRKQDIARGVMDRSRTDLSTALVMSRYGRK